MSEKKFAIISGASGGIGAAIAKKLAENYHLILLGRNASKLQSLVESLSKTNIQCQAQYHLVDFEDAQAVVRLADKLKTYKGKVKALLSSVGVVPVGALQQVHEADWLKAFQISLMGAVRLVKHFSPLMSGESSIVLVNGVLATQPNPDLVISSVIAGALKNFSKAMSKDLIIKGIRINSVYPSATATPLLEKIAETFGGEDVSSQHVMENIAADNPMKRIAQPSDIANAVNFLISSESRYINGASINIDGGVSSYA